MKRLADNAIINPNVYNGTNKMREVPSNFMTAEAVMRAMRDIKLKNTEGVDRIPQRITTQ